MKKILVPTDFSALSEKALNVAAEISRKTKAEIELLHVIDSPNDRPFSSTGDLSNNSGTNDLFVLKSVEAANKKFKKITDDVRYVGIRFITKIKTGDIYHSLYESIVKEKSDLIVMGTKGSNGLLKGIFNRSNTEEVVSHTDTMVLTVKEGTNDFKIRNVIFATDFKDYSPQFIKNLTDLQEIFDFKLHLLYVNSVLEHKDKLDDVVRAKEVFLKRFKISNCEFVVEEDFTQYTGITEYASKVKADIIALSTHQRKGFWHWVGGLSEDLVNYSTTPVLTYKAE